MNRIQKLLEYLGLESDPNKTFHGTLSNEDYTSMKSLGLSEDVLSMRPMPISEKEESDPSLKPPKGWMDKMVASGKNPALVGHIWYHLLTPEKRSSIRDREEKSYGKAEA